MSAITLRTLNPTLSELARKNCNEDPKTVIQQILVIQEWIENSPYLKLSTNPQLILAFLRRSRFHLEVTKKRIRNYSEAKNCFPEVLCERELNQKLMEIYDTGTHIIPNKAITHDGPVIIISQSCKINSNQLNPHLTFKLLLMLLEVLAMENDNASIFGLIYVIDCRDVDVDLLMRFESKLMQKVLNLMECCMPLKLNEIHVINLRHESLHMINFDATFISRSRLSFKILVHKKAEDLFEYVPRDAMTVEYGGHNGYISEAIEAFKQKLLEYKEYFVNNSNYCINEKLRIGHDKKLELCNLSGVMGCFRKLELD